MSTFQISVCLRKALARKEGFSSVSTNVILAKLLTQNYEGTHTELLLYFLIPMFVPFV